MKIKSIILFVLLGLIVSVCMSCKEQISANINTPATIPVDSVLRAINIRNRIFAEALSNGDSVGVAACYTIDAQFMAPNGPSVVGRNNIAGVMGTFIDAGITKYMITYSAVLLNSDTLAAAQQAYQLSAQDGSNMDIGKSVQVWKVEDGVWKIYRDCFNSDLPATTNN
jgi:ketosteroid isomerase-like protein